MNRRALTLLAFALVLPAVVYATGFGGDSPPSRIPIPARDFSAQVEDHGGVTVDVERVSYNGEVFLYGTLGMAQVTLPFESLARVEFSKDADPDKRQATATTVDGRTLTIIVDHDVLCYGKTKFGNYAIEVEDLRRIAFRVAGEGPSDGRDGRRGPSDAGQGGTP